MATSLCPDEAEPKHCFLLDSTRGLREPCVQPIRLLTPRQLFYEELNLDELCLAPPSENVRLRENMTVRLTPTCCSCNPRTRSICTAEWRRSCKRPRPVATSTSPNCRWSG